ncbi:hypothetical protein LC609_04600 [Nostoc sp. XA013]|nr:hypothetical protein [Nostoc sp. XA013]
MRKTTIFTFTLLSLAILPAMAQVNTELGQVWNDIKLYSAEMEKYFQNNLSDNLKPLEAQSRSALESSKSERELKIPNPVTAGKNIRDNLIINSYSSDPRASRFENNVAVRGNSASNEINRFITRGAAEAFLGKDGQNRTQEKLENTENKLEEITTSAEQAEGAKNSYIQNIQTALSSPTIGTNSPVVQGILNLAQLIGVTQLQTIRIQEAQSQFLGETFAQTIQTNQSLQYSNLNLANISQQAEEANRARRVDTSTEAARLLRATSQLDLFGREVEN